MFLQSQKVYRPTVKMERLSEMTMPIIMEPGPCLLYTSTAGGTGGKSHRQVRFEAFPFPVPAGNFQQEMQRGAGRESGGAGRKPSGAGREPRIRGAGH